MAICEQENLVYGELL